MLKKLTAHLALGFVLIAVPLQAIAQDTAQGPSPYGPHWGLPGPWHGSHFWWVCPLLFLFMFVVLGGLFFYRRSWGEHGHHWRSPWHMMEGPCRSPTHSALQILNERFARGEIQKEEYEDKKAVILSGAKH